MSWEEPVAVIGVGCRFPAQADTPGKFFKVLMQGKDIRTAPPVSRWPKAYEAMGDAAHTPVRGTYVDNVDQFDSQYFGLKDEEVEEMDPQQRLALEVCADTLRNAGYLKEEGGRGQSIAGKNDVGVFLGIATADSMCSAYQTDITPHTLVGNLMAGAANRVSFCLGLTGPSLVVDTMCSSSLYSIHLAAASVLNGDCDMALASGSNVITNPASYVMLNKLGVLSPEFICRAFDGGAKGYVRGEGCGAVLLKKLSQAERDGDKIIGVIRASAIKHNGAGRNIAAPSVPGQMIVIQQALDRAKLKPADIDLLEAHATGTKAGDKKELETINTMYSKDDRSRGPVVVGAVKSMFGHSEGASGITEFIKALLSLYYRQAPPNINFSQLRPDVEVDLTKIQLSNGVDLSQRQEPLRAGVNSFGAGGTNAHIIVESYGAKGDWTSDELGKPGPYQRHPVSLISQRNDLYVPSQMREFIALSEDLKSKVGLERRKSKETLVGVETVVLAK